jgi:murein DD-endopeptidase MepM/ murein hydrolase activator NlpD
MVSLSIDPPPSSRQPRSSRGGLVGILFGTVVLLALAGGFWLGRATAPGGSLSDSPEPSAAAPAPLAAEAQPPAPGGVAAAPLTVAAPGAPAAAAPIPAPVAIPAAPTAKRVNVVLQGALEESIARALPREDRPIADQLTQVVNRLLVWDLQVARDGRKGDRLDIVYTPSAPVAPGLPPSAEPVVEAVRYVSQKLGKAFSVYRFQPEGARFARYYREDATELEEHLVDAPIGEYEQITSLLRDGRRHKGVDYKAPVGSPVLAPFDGVVQRRTWNFRGTGNCLDILDPASGRHAIFLHLDAVPKEMAVGRRVKKGEHIALSGNSGHSFAPHLHYQLEDANGRVLDPFDVHKTERRALAAVARPAFDVRRGALDAAFGGAATAAVVPAVHTAPAP